MVGTKGTSVVGPVPENSSGFSTLRPELPELPYSIRDHLKNIIFIWTLFTLDTAVLPLSCSMPYGTTHRKVPPIF